MYVEYRAFSVFENIENLPFYVPKNKTPFFLSFRVSAITKLLIFLLIKLHIFEIVFLMRIFRRIRQSNQDVFFSLFFGMFLFYFSKKGSLIFDTADQIKSFLREDTHKKKCFFSGRTTKSVGWVNPPEH